MRTLDLPPSPLRIQYRSVTVFSFRPRLQNEDQGLVPSMSSSRHTLRGSPLSFGSFDLDDVPS
jgi:hypothetical protein